jgi:hypothetical protein
VFQTPKTVGVVIDMMRQLEAQLMMRSYQGFSASALLVFYDYVTLTVQ